MNSQLQGTQSMLQRVENIVLEHYINLQPVSVELLGLNEKVLENQNNLRDLHKFERENEKNLQNLLGKVQENQTKLQTVHALVQIEQIYLQVTKNNNIYYSSFLLCVGVVLLIFWVQCTSKKYSKHHIKTTT